MNATIKYYELESSLNESICLHQNNSEDILLEMISVRIDMTDHIVIPLSENINVVNIFNEYVPLIEAVDALADAKKSVSELKDMSPSDKQKDSVLKKCINSVKRAINWWYKIEPDKKFKTLHTILKILVAVLMIVVSVYATKTISDKAVTTGIIAALPDKIIKGKKKDISVKYGVVSTIVGTAIGKIQDYIQTISTTIEFSINKTDLDKNISELDKSIDVINSKLDSDNLDPEVKSDLIKTKKELSHTLSKMIKLKDRIK